MLNKRTFQVTQCRHCRPSKLLQASKSFQETQSPAYPLELGQSISEIQRQTKGDGDSSPDLHINRGRHVLLVHCPHATQIQRIVPCIQDSNHASYAREVALKHILQVVAAVGCSMHYDSELIVRKEAHEKIARTSQTFLERLQSAPHLRER